MPPTATLHLPFQRRTRTWSRPTPLYPKQEHRKLVFFDLDQTLLSYNSAFVWMIRELRGGHITAWQALVGCWWYLLYALGLTQLDDVLRRASTAARGRNEAETRARVRAFWEDDVSHHLRRRCIEVIEAHRRQGHEIALLTAASDYLSEHVAKHCGIPHVLSNRFEVENNQFTGKLEEPLCFGQGKLHHARRLARRLGYRLEDCVFYTDSYSDIHAMEAMGEAIAVHPDLRLARAARDRGWKIAYWD